MATEVVCGLIFRVLLPVCLAAGKSLHRHLFSVFAPVKGLGGYTGHLLKSLCFCSMTFLFIHIIYQITIHSLLAANSISSEFNCPAWEKSIRQIGFESVIGADAGNGIRVFLPDIGMFMASLSVWLLCRKLVHKLPSEEMAQDNYDFEAEEEEESDEKVDDGDDDDDEMIFDEDFDAEDEAEEEDGEGGGLDEEEEVEEEVQESLKMKILRRVAGVPTKLKEIIGNLITTAGQVVVTILLGLTGVTLPSLSSAVYFFVFLGLCTWWSLCKTFDKLLFSCLCVLMAIFSAGHLIILYSNQFQFLQEAISLNDSYTSLFGISSIVRTDCSSTWRLAVNSGLNWHHFVNPIMLLVLYYTLATLIRLWLQDPMIMQESEEEGINEGDETTDISHFCAYYMTCHLCNFFPVIMKVMMVNSNGTSFDYVSAAPIENGPVSLDIYSTPQYKVDQPLIKISPLSGAETNALVKVFKFIMKQSYICALIAMMAWSITYVSWPTFVFLLWSCTLWMVRDRRKYAMLTSPFMVAYGNLLLVLQYIWCFERLSPVPGFFLKMEVPFSELSSKVLCQLSFWLLLRQTLMERQEKMEEEATLCDVKVDEQEKKEGDENDLMHVIGKLVMALLVKYWIYICGGMFFFVSFEGKMVMYKIVYMMMFLSCVALYQVHYEWWRRILKYFWMSVVMYTMLVLILIYTCQFENAIHTWSNMTGMSVDGLEAMGLEKYSLSELFTRIFIPTSFLLVCILHLHYFHDRFLQLTDLKAVISKEQSTIYRLAHPDGSLADLTMISTSSEPLLKEEKEKESMNEVLVVDCVDEEEKKESLSIHSAHLSSVRSLLPSVSDLKNKWHLVVDRLTVLFLRFLEYFHKLKLFIWWLLEMHIIKIVSTYIILLSVKEVSLLNYVFLISWAFALPYKQFRVLASSVCTVWTCVIIICKLFYQLKTIEPRNYSSICTMPSNYTKEQKMDMNHSLLYRKPVDPANWVGLEKFEEPVLPNLRNNLLMLAILAFEVTIYRHQEFFRLRNKLSPPPSRTIFHDITRQHLDNSIINCVKYFINYFFYKFGLEVCFLLAINVMGQRMDFYSMLHGLALAVVMYRRRRKAIAEIWPKYCCFLACMITFQYFICIGIPPAACKDYPWRFSESMMDSDIVKWLFLPDFHTQPNSMFLVYDFMLLLCASLQRQVFEDENKAAVRLMAGDNVEICRDLDAASFSVHNPVPDFIHCRSYLDMLKVIMFSYLFWFVLTIIFITGTTRISIFCMGYLVACFYFLLFGGDLLLKPIKKLLRYWDFLIAYNVFVITMKNVFAILACGYIKHLVKNSCWLVQLLSLACTIKEYKALEGVSLEGCEVPKDEAGIIWDSICFTFLLLQRRVFMSYYFLHVVADIRAGQILASRGAELFQASIVKAVRARLEEEKRSMEQLKRQMDRIKTRQQKFKRGKEKMLSMAQESGDGQKLIHPDNNDDDVVRSGDYYLFETDSEEEEEEEDKKDEEQPKRSAFLFVYRTWIADSKAALNERGKGKRHFWKRYGRRRRKDKKEDHVAIEIDEEDRQSSEEDKADGPDNIIKRVFNIIKFTWMLFLTTVESITKWLNSVCREYIDISTVLRIERCMLTREVKKFPQLDCEEHREEEQCISEDEDGEQPIRQDEGESSGPENVQMDVVSGQLFTPDTDAPNTSDADVPPSYSKAVSFDHLSVSSDESDSDKRLMLMTPDSRSDLDDPLMPSMTTDLTASELLLNKMFYDEELENSESFYKSQPLGLQLCYALYNLLVAHSEMVCFLVIILNHMISASMATLVLPILIFLWAMLSVPRPSKRFWMTAIVYTEVTIVVKYFFQFSFFPFNQNLEVNKGKPYHPPNIIGTEKKEGYVHYDLVQLLVLFFHRSILKVRTFICHIIVMMLDIENRAALIKQLSSIIVLFHHHCGQVMKLTVFSLLFCRVSLRLSIAMVTFGCWFVLTGSTSTWNSIHRENSTTEPEVPQKSRKEMIMKKIREQLIKVKVYVIKKLVEFYQPIRQFFYNLIHPEYNAVTDVYVLMFLADTVDFIIIVFGFWAFGKHQGGADITSSLSEDQVPGPFLVMVLIQFGTMVVDRALYLRKTVMGKVIFQVVLVFGIHFWMFFILPGITERRFSQNTIAQLWYFVKCIYFGLSAYQIRCGYPTRILGNFLTKSYNYVNLFLFQGFRLIPFLTELRAVMDWVWTDTTLSLSSWICVEDIYAHIFILKCWRESEKRYPQPRGQKKKKVVKYGMGGMIVMLLICIVWFPLLFMSLIKSVAGVVNTPLDVSVTLTLGGLQPIFTMSAQQNHLKHISSREFEKLKKHHTDASAMLFLESYNCEDLTIAELEGSSNSLWTISPPSRKNLINMLNDTNETFPLTFTWSIQRNLSLGAKAETAIGKHSIDLDKPTRTKLKSLLNGTKLKEVVITNIFPRYIRAPSDSNAKPIVQLYKSGKTPALHQQSNESIQEWWTVNQTEAGPLSVRDASESGLELYIFSDQVSPPSLGFLAGYGIMGLYMSVVLVIGKFVREFFSGISHTIMFEELPHVDRILKLCTDIFLVRETGELDLEEDLYAKLIFLYRSPETMIKWTREKSE
uniref:Piezo-type mechanosensitive ion channel component n=1 Tax=Cyprinus carpio carpio TaxID=630221 RepID=A0A9J8A2B2_CYPCA